MTSDQFAQLVTALHDIRDAIQAVGVAMIVLWIGSVITRERK